MVFDTLQLHMVAARSLNLRRAMIEGLGNAPRTAPHAVPGDSN
jgi:hypothetical protein